ncbi:transglutaminase-like domain-containing protein [Alkalihalobacillus trypoxylicola]|uniref:Transglutaminase n=1 Tax=Alkalihalobacillus trypoxylicola TaxID=519424 RepID=A0A162D0J0_9BACI|nr:transglutaminase family protein [Alkalihalobacillus trypoxylicola]KYG27598.1 transglutaminase [Alkalihalobacillus trypoxylicola]
MLFYPESSELKFYLQQDEWVDYRSENIQKLSKQLFSSIESEEAKVEKAFNFVRDEIDHSWDIQGKIVTCKASDVLDAKEGICYAKSNLLAAVLRSQDIPVGFCYQKLVLFDTPESGYCIHALNAVFLSDIKKWIRLDARGNKEGIDAQFSINEEKLAFPVQSLKGEIDYPVIYFKPNQKTMAVLHSHTNVRDMYLNHLPQEL